ncbi:MAG TPA: hypothetical protein VH107_07895 [Lacipirellulaceae bacterium]|jgi:hypothetical protein|nr:hypothetical protein [Lacipirellulaceae bacterium]
MKSVLAVSVFFALGVVAALADGDGEPVLWRRGGQEVIMHSSMKPLNIIVGDTPLGKPTTFTCKSAKGCVIISSVSVIQNVGNTGICTYIDGVAGAPGCIFQQEVNSEVIRQQAKVISGPHTIQTIFHAENPGQVIGWETDYTIYERKVRGAD